jgi:serine/threonine-protein kinase RsbW
MTVATFDPAIFEPALLPALVETTEAPRESAATVTQSAVRTLADGTRWVGRIDLELRGLGYCRADRDAIHLALGEAVHNAIRHGHHNDPAKCVRCRHSATPDGFWAEVEDDGPGFDPQRVPDPTLPENLHRTGGRGLALIGHLMSHVHFNPRGNCIYMKRLRTV